LLLVTLPLTAVALALGPEAIEEVFGHNYAGAGAPVRILLLAFPVIALSTLATSLLSGYRKIRLPIVANAIAAVVDVGLAAGLVPVLDARGAAVANAAGQGMFALLMLVFAGRLVRPVDWRPGMVVRVVLVSAGVGLVGWAAITWLDGIPGLAVGLAASVVAFAALATTLRIVPSDDARWAEQSFGARVGRVVRYFSFTPPGGD
jgi:O-antigen/teichoic acid export membrane protein